ncbi:MAG: hypothetical protein ACRD2E_06940 [Terriglobales bacterium]
MKRVIGTVCALVLLSTVSLWAQDLQHSELSIQVMGVFTQNANVNNLTASPTSIQNDIVTDSAGVLVGYRLHLTSWEALEAEWGYTQNGQRYYASSAPYGVGPAAYSLTSRMNDLDANEVITTPRLLGFFQPFILAGGGAVIFSPSNANILGTSRQTEGMWDYGAGLDFHIDHIGARLEFRELNFKTPNYGVPKLLTINKWTHTASPSVGLVFTF